MVTLPVRLLYLCKQMSNIALTICRLLAWVKQFTYVNTHVTELVSSLTLTLLQETLLLNITITITGRLLVSQCYTRITPLAAGRAPLCVLHVLLQDRGLIIAFIGFQA